MSKRSMNPRPIENVRPNKNEYVAIGIYTNGSTAASLLAVGGKIVLFDTRVMAQQWLPLLGMGRSTHWDPTGESAFWLPIDVNGINRADILTSYNPYDLPAGMSGVKGKIRSEVLGKEWKHHILWNHAFYDCGQFEKQADGTMRNRLLGG